MATSLNAHKKAILTTTPDSIGTTQSNFDRKQFDDFITNKGYDCYIERSIKCPCEDEATGQALPNCLNCGGTGWAFIDKQETRVACVNINNINKYQQWSQANLGTVSISARPQDRLGYMDRVTLIELEMIYSEKRKLYLSDDGTKVFTLTTYYPLEIFHMFLFNGPTSQYTYINPTQYTFKDNQIVLDFATFEGQVGVNQITLRYAHNPAFFILNANRDLIKQRVGKNCTTLQINETNLPLNYTGRLAHYVLDAPNLTGDSLIDNTNYTVNPPNYDV